MDSPFLKRRKLCLVVDAVSLITLSSRFLQGGLALPVQLCFLTRSGHDQCVRDHLVDADDRIHLESIARQDFRELRLADGADRRHMRDPVLVGYVTQRPHAWHGAFQAEVYQLVREQAAATAAAQGAFADRVRRHVEEMVADGAKNRARNLELTARLASHPRGTRDVAGIVKCQPKFVVLRLVEAQRALLDEVVGEFANMLWERIVPVEEVERARKRIEEAVGNAPGMSAFAKDDALDAKILRGLADPQRDLLHGLL